MIVVPAAVVDRRSVSLKALSGLFSCCWRRTRVSDTISVFGTAVFTDSGIIIVIFAFAFADIFVIVVVVFVVVIVVVVVVVVVVFVVFEIGFVVTVIIVTAKIFNVNLFRKNICRFHNVYS